MTLVGRDGELAALREACLRARGGRGQVIVVSGEPGLGKSALAEQIAGEAAFAVTWGRAWELADAPAYFPLWPCLKSLGIAHGESGAFELWEQVLDALARASHERPVMWIVEDLHVADTQTLDLLCFLAQAIRALPVVLLLTTRTQDPRLDETAQQRIVRLARAGLELRLAPLAPAQVSALATQWLGRAPSADEAARLAERTGGNPLFVIECARSGSTAVPETVAVVVAERVALLAAAARALVGDAAVLGNEVTAAALGGMSGTLPARVIDDLAPVLRAGILLELAPGRYRFSHALVRDAIEAAMAPAERRAAHARALASLPDDAQHAVERARHAIASHAPDVARIVEGTIAVLESQGTHDRAHALYRQLDELRAAGVLPAATAAELVRAARVALAAAKHADHRALCLRALEAARDATEYANAALALGAEIQTAQIDPVLLQHLEVAVAGLGEERSPLRCRLTARLAAAMQPAVDPRVPIEMARTAIAQAREAGDPVLLDDVLYAAISTMIEFVDAAELCELFREHLDLALASGDVTRTLRAYARLILTEGELGDFAAQERHIEQMQRLARMVGHPGLTWRALLIASMQAVARGQFAESDRYLTEVERAAQFTDDPSLLMSLNAHRHERALEMYRDSTVAANLAQIDAILMPLPAGRMLAAIIRGLAAARFGDRAAAELALAAVPFESLLARESTSTPATVGEICAAGGTPEQKRAALARLAPFADRHIHFGHAPMIYAGPVRRVIGLLELSLGNQVAGQQHLRRALDQMRALGFAPWVARISYELGDLDEAARLATNLGMKGLAKRAHAQTAETASPPTRPSLGMVREGDVWRISYGVRVARIADSRGMELIAKLVERPGEEMHVLALAGTGGEALTESHAGEALDDKAARSYRERLAALRGELAHAEGGKRQQLERERDFLEGELARGFGMTGARKTGSMSERARVNVQRRIKDSLARIGQHDSVIADYLRGAIRTGTYCTFRP